MDSILISKNCFLIHGLTRESPKGDFYQRIQFIINQKNAHELCVSTVSEGDISQFTYYSPFGLIIGDVNNVAYCRNIDGGTLRLENGDLIGDTEGGFHNPNHSQILSSIEERPSTQHNEFRINGYNVFGFYLRKDASDVNFIENEEEFYNKTVQYGLPYFFTVNGWLKEVMFDLQNRRFCYFKNRLVPELYGGHIRSRFVELSIHTLDIDFTQYLTITGKRFYGLLISSKDKKVQPLFGNPPSDLIDYVTQNFVEAKAGYRLDVHKQIKILPASDLLLVSEELLSSPKRDVETILVHELTHMTIDSNNVRVTSNEADIETGDEFYKNSGQYDEYRTKHSKDFCRLLATTTRKYNEYTNAFQTNREASISSFRYDLPDE